jgi:hypothetical protein
VSLFCKLPLLLPFVEEWQMIRLKHETNSTRDLKQQKSIVEIVNSSINNCRPYELKTSIDSIS